MLVRRKLLFARKVVLLILFNVLCRPASAQNALDDVHIFPRAKADLASAPSATGALIRKSVDLVLVPVSVTDDRDRLVFGLGPGNFTVLDDKRKQQIKHFSSEDSPVSIGVIVDISGSMKDKVERAREAVHQFCEIANLQDEFFLITFSDEPRLLTDFTDPEQIEQHLLFAPPHGRTALLDAIYLGMRKMREAKYPKKALLIISDGGDNHSRYSERELTAAVKESDVTIYAIGTFDRYVSTQEELLGPELLSNIADFTGGRAFVLDNPNDMPALARHIGIELRTQYVLGYRPEELPHNGKWHKIVVKLVPPKHLPFLRVRARAGYYAAAGEEASSRASQ